MHGAAHPSDRARLTGIPRGGSPQWASSFALLALSFLSNGCAPLPDSADHLEGPIEGLSAQQTQLFLRGDVLFNQMFSARTGLGPTFNGPSCVHCHPGDGAGHPATMLTRFGVLRADGQFDALRDRGGPQLQNHALDGFSPETIPEPVNAITQLIAPAVTGLGYLEAIDDATLLALEDVDDRDGDGISGRIHWVSSSDRARAFAELERRGEPDAERFLEHPQGYIGRFGRKGAILSLHEQTGTALRDDMGITSRRFPEENHAVELLGLTATSAATTDISDGDVHALVFYLKTLRVPPRRTPNASSVVYGEQVFHAIGCAGCHVDTFVTGASSLPALHRQTIHPYSDLLLHDMGPSLDDVYTEGSAASYEWRTTPLWGFGLRRDAQGGQLYLLHDGRARSVSEAIEYHGGEAARARQGYRALSEHDRSALEAFLLSL